MMGDVVRIRVAEIAQWTRTVELLSKQLDHLEALRSSLKASGQSTAPVDGLIRDVQQSLVEASDYLADIESE